VTSLADVGATKSKDPDVITFPTNPT